MLDGESVTVGGTRGFDLDEANYLMADSTPLDFLEAAVRHSRHYDLSLHFITQTGGNLL